MTDRLAQLEALSRDLARALRYHIEADAKRAGVAPSVVCPCLSDELARADALLEPGDWTYCEPCARGIARRRRTRKRARTV